MHFYTQTGQPCYTVPKANGQGDRDCHIGDARKLSLVPSVTTIMRNLSKSGLDRWKLLKLLEFVGSNLDLINGYDKWKEVVLSAFEEDNSKYSKRGTEIHDKLEAYYNGTVNDLDTDVEIIIAVDESIKRIVKNPRPEVAFSHPLGFGGKVDLVGTNCILDFKTRQNETFDKRSVYDEYVMQLAAYRLGLKMPLADCYNVLISVTKPGVVYVHKWEEAEIQRGEKMFRAMLEYWKLVNKYDSSYEEIT